MKRRTLTNPTPISALSEMVDLNRRGEYGGRAAQIERELKNNIMFAGWSKTGKPLYLTATNRRVKDFDVAVNSYAPFLYTYFQ